MIYLYSGTPGSGKSMHVAKDMKRWLEWFKAPVIANFPFKADACHERGNGCYLYVPNDILCPELLIDFSETYRKRKRVNRLPEDEILLVIDECQIIFNAREWNKKGMKEWLSFFTQHRKYSYRIILIAQFCNMIDRQIRSVIEYEFIHRKVKNIGKGGFIMNLLVAGNLHVCVKMYKPLNMRCDSEFFRADKKICSLYNSYARFSAATPE